VACGIALGATVAYADPVRVPDNSVFVGTGSDGGSVTVRALTSSMFDVSYAFGAVLPGSCQSAFATRMVLRPDGMSFGSANLTAERLVNVHLTAVVDPDQARTIAGLTMAEGTGPLDCGRHRATWLAVRQEIVTTSPPLSRPDSLYAGAATVFGQSGSGTVSLTTDRAGALRSVAFDVVQGGCTYRASTDVLEAPVPFDGPGVQHIAEGWSMAALAEPRGMHRVAVLGAADCPDIPVVFSTNAPTSIPAVVVPTATPPAAPAPGRGTFLGAPVFSSGGTASVVYSGGTVADLEAAVVAGGGSGAWLQDATGEYRLLIVGAPPFLREAFQGAFPAGFSAPVAVTVTR